MIRFYFLFLIFLSTCDVATTPKKCLDVNKTKQIVKVWEKQKVAFVNFIYEAKKHINALQDEHKYKLGLTKYKEIFTYINNKLEANRRLGKNYRRLANTCKSKDLEKVSLFINKQKSFILRVKKKLEFDFLLFKEQAEVYFENKKIRNANLPIIKKYEAKCKPQFILQGVKSGCEKYFSALQTYCKSCNPTECSKEGICVRSGIASDRSTIKFLPKIYLLALKRKLAPLKKKVENLHQNCVKSFDRPRDTCMEFLEAIRDYCPKLSFKSLCKQHNYCVWEDDIEKPTSAYCWADNNYAI